MKPPILDILAPFAISGLFFKIEQEFDPITRPQAQPRIFVPF
jgi:hypothetical protein